MPRGTHKSDWKVAFDSNGNHLPWDGYGRGESYEPADTTFTADLAYLDYERGRSSVNVTMVDTQTGRKYKMFLAEFMRLVEQLQNGVLSGTWGFVKNGSNTGIVRISG